MIIESSCFKVVQAPTLGDPTEGKRPNAKEVLGSLVGVGLVLSGCATSPEVVITSTPEPSITSSFFDYLQRGRAMATLNDIQMLNTTIPGIDLTYYGNPTVQYIRSIEDPVERVATAIGFLNVQKSGRYNGKTSLGEVYTCNTYALDLLRLLLGNDAIGSRYNRATGEPTVLGLNDIDWTNTALVAQNNAQYPFLDSNNLDWWMRTYGTQKYGWQQVESPEELQKMIATGRYVALAVTSNEYIQETHLQYGHSAVILPDQDDSMILTQSTSNILAKPISSKNDRVVDATKGFHYFIHELPPAVPLP